jgi:hypothetical protein
MGRSGNFEGAKKPRRYVSLPEKFVEDHRRFPESSTRSANLPSGRVPLLLIQQYAMASY